jgi:hypothetical protein
MKYDDDIVKHKSQSQSKSKSKKKKNMNTRYSNLVHDDSDDPDVPNENLKDLSLVEFNNEHDESSVISNYQTVPESVKRNQYVYGTESCKINLYAPIRIPKKRITSPLVNQSYELKPGINVDRITPDSMSDI